MRIEKADMPLLLADASAAIYPLLNRISVQENAVAQILSSTMGTLVIGLPPGNVNSGCSAEQFSV
jgi:hypothetical protein